MFLKGINVSLITVPILSVDFNRKLVVVGFISFLNSKKLNFPKLLHLHLYRKTRKFGKVFLLGFVLSLALNFHFTFIPTDFLIALSVSVVKQSSFLFF